MNLTRRHLILLAATACAWTMNANAQTYPSKPVRIVLPYGAGGPGDVMVRAIGQQMGDLWGQPFIVENKPGANEIIAADAVAKSPGDGYTFLVASDAVFSTNQHLYKKLPYDPLKDFVPVARFAVGNLMLVTRPDLPVSSVKELIEYVKQRPGKLNYASLGAGGVNHLSSSWFNNINGLQMEHIPFKSLPAAVQELMAGRVDVMFAVTGGVAPYLEGGKVKALAVSGRNRQPAAPNVPTFAEVGFPSFDASYYFGVAAPKGTPAEITARFAQDLSKVVNMPAFKKRYMEPLGFDAVSDTPEQFAAFLVDDRKLAAQKVKTSGAVLE